MTERPPESVTRGFLFADLRGYTDFVESHGAAAAASLLTRYRDVARDAIGRFDGAEIKTEGDSFYVVFSSVSGAVRCGLALVADAESASVEHPEQPIRVGVGIHAGETVELDDGYVGSAVNIAARLCGQAGAGEVVVSETVRALTRTVLPVEFRPRGRRQLKGIADPIELFAVVPASEAEAWADGGRRRPPRRRQVAIFGIGAILLVSAVGVAAWALRPPAALPAGEWTIGLDMPMSGPFAEFGGVPMRNAVQMAIDEVNDAGELEGVELVLETYDHAGPDGEQVPEPALAAENATAMVEDAATIALISPYNSLIAYDQIPITNEAGLLQCSPSTTDPALTKPDYGALDLRGAQPERINFVRTAPSDDNQIRGLAAFATRDLGAESVLVVNNERDFELWADSFEESFTDLGGRVVRVEWEPGSDASEVLAPLSGGDAFDAVFYGGFDPVTGAELRRAMVDDGFGDLPFLAADPVLGTGDESYLAEAGEAAVGSYASHSSIGPYRASFVDDYRSAFGEEPDEYAAAAHACAEVIIQALAAIVATGPSAEALREALRAHVLDPESRFETVLGTVGFDANGDSIQQFVNLYRVDPEAADGAGDWVVIKQQDYGVAPG